MKTTFLQLVTSTLSRLDPIYPRTTSHYDYEVPDEAASHAPVHVPVPVDRNEAAQYAFFLAVLSGLSLPIGAMLGVKLQPADTTIARWIAIGAGALLFAVAVELYGHSIHSFSAGHTELGPMMILLVMSLFGSYLFTYLARWFEGEEDSDSESSDDEEEARKSDTPQPGSPVKFKAKTEGHSFETGSPAKGSVDRRGSLLGGPATPPTPLQPAANGSHDTFGRRHSLSMMDMGQHHHHHHGAVLEKKAGRGLAAIARQVAYHKRWKAQMRWAHLREAMKKYHIIRFMQKSATMKKSQAVASPRRGTPRKATSMADVTDFWANMKEAWQSSNDSDVEVKASKAEKEASAAAMSMLTMLIVDGIPEGILMGFMAASGTLGFTFVLSLVIANFPEGFAGGQLMNIAGMPLIQIFLAWAGPMLLTAIGAFIACNMLLWLSPPTEGHHATPYSIQVIVCATEGVAGGAMISGIAATMLPEAYERRDKKGGILGSGGFLCTAGFLLAFGIKIALD